MENKEEQDFITQSAFLSKSKVSPKYNEPKKVPSRKVLDLQEMEIVTLYLEFFSLVYTMKKSELSEEKVLEILSRDHVKKHIAGRQHELEKKIIISKIINENALNELKTVIIAEMIKIIQDKKVSPELKLEIFNSVTNQTSPPTAKLRLDMEIPIEKRLQQMRDMEEISD